MGWLIILIVSSISVKGKVLSAKNGVGIPYASIRVVETGRGTMADENGRFKLEIAKPGRYSLEVSALGFKRKIVRFEAIEGETVELKIGLKEEIIRLKDLIVTPGSFSVTDQTTPEKGTLTTMDVYLTPGSAADLLMTIQALPGVNNVGDDAAISVQGGELDELGVRINGLWMPHPFHYESGGGIFSMLDETMIRKSDLYAGGYPASFGNALSGVLDIKLKSGEVGTDGSLDMSMAGLGASFHHNNFRISAARSFFDLLAKFFGMGEGYTSYPSSWDLHSVYTSQLNEKLAITAFTVLGGDHVGVDMTDEGFSGEFKDRDSKGLVGTNLVASTGKWTFDIATGVNFRGHRWQFTEGWFWEESNRAFELNMTASREFNDRSLIEFGFNGLHSLKRFKYEVPEDLALIRDPNAARKTGERKIRDWLLSGYLLHRRTLTNSLVLEIGLRGGHYTYTGRSVLLPRLGLAYRIASNLNLRFGTGLYSQVPSIREIDSVFGNPDLDFELARHLALALERNGGPITAKFQVFYKRYERLPVPWDDSYESKGTGRSYGVEFFAKFTPDARWMGWISYTYLRSFRAADSTLTEYRSDFDTPHILTVVGDYDLGRGWTIGFKAKYSTGRPYTPVVGRIEVSPGSYKPIYGEHNSERYPDYFRLDIRVTKITTLFGHSFISYWEFMNVTDHENVQEWVYSEDYSERKPIRGFGRMFVGGIILRF